MKKILRIFTAAISVLLSFSLFAFTCLAEGATGGEPSVFGFSGVEAKYLVYLGGLVLIGLALLIAAIASPKKKKPEADEAALLSPDAEIDGIASAPKENSVSGSGNEAEEIVSEASAVEAVAAAEAMPEVKAAEKKDAEPKPEPSLEQVIARIVDSEEDEDPDEETVDRRWDGERHSFIVIKYSKSFTARLIQAKDETKDYYSQLKNEILAYVKPKSRISWRHELFRVGRESVVRMQIRGRTLCLYLALDPKEYSGTKYKLEDVSSVAKNAGFPSRYRINSQHRLELAKDLIAVMMAKYSLRRVDSEAIDYAKEYPYEDNDALVKRELIKVLSDEESHSGAAFKSKVRREISVTEVNGLMTDAEAAAGVDRALRKADKTRKSFVNIDTLSEYFEDGETVTLSEIKRRIPSFDKKATYLKVLARGTLSRALIVDADDFSVEAEKMILLTGGVVLCSDNK